MRVWVAIVEEAAAGVVEKGRYYRNQECVYEIKRTGLDGWIFFISTSIIYYIMISQSLAHVSRLV